jgi:hypothetical protein
MGGNTVTAGTVFVEAATVTVVAGIVVTPPGSVTVVAGTVVVNPGDVMVVGGWVKATVTVVVVEQAPAVKTNTIGNIAKTLSKPVFMFHLIQLDYTGKCWVRR